MMDDGVLWAIIMAIALVTAWRWVTAGGMSPVSHQTIRQLLLYHLHLVCREVEVRVEEERRLVLLLDGKECRIHLDQLYRRCAVSPAHLNTLIHLATEGIRRALNDGDVLPEDWAHRVLPLLVRSDAPLPPEMLVRPLAGRLAIGYVLDGAEAFRWITRRDLERAGVVEAQLHDAALGNVERSCNRLEIETLGVWPDGHERLLRFTTNDGLDAARLLVPSFFRRFSPRFGDTDLVVAIPTRDMLAMVSTRDASHAGLLEWRARHERRHQAYPLHDALLRLTDRGLEAWEPDTST